jgi:DNA-binding CsgD family transcriptional regulator
VTKLGADTSAPTGRAPGPRRSIVGRDSELAILAPLLGPAQVMSEVRIITGEAGVGKSALLDEAIAVATGAGRRVLRAVGSELEAHLAFAGLHALLQPVLPLADGLPARQRRELLAAFGMEPTPPDGANAMTVGLAVLTLLSDVAESTPLLIVVDDAQWVDGSSLQVLSFVARRLQAEAITVLIGMRAGEDVPGLDHPTVFLEPLDTATANRLLDHLPDRPGGRIRARILEEASGNPLALIELSRVARSFPEVHRTTPDGPLPTTQRLERIFAKHLAQLPAATRDALLILAAADAADPTPVVALGLPDTTDEAWLPAERASLVRQLNHRICFRHPLIRSAVYHSSSFAARRAAHLALAERLSGEPDRRAWHRAAATLRPDAAIAAELEATADRARLRGGYAAATAALERAAELSPDTQDRARLLVDAAGFAVFTGQLPWVTQLASQAISLTHAPSLRRAALLRTGQLLVLTSDHAAAYAHLADLARDTAAEAPAIALDALAAAAVVAYYSGLRSQRQQCLGIMATVRPQPADAVLRAWVSAVVDPHAHRAELRPALPGLLGAARNDPRSLTALAVVAWMLDEPRLAIDTFDAASRRWQAREPLPEGLGSAAGWAYFELGDWAQARVVAAEVTGVAEPARLAHAAACAAALDATVLGVSGDAEGARAASHRALALVDPLESRSVSVYAHRALGLAAVAEGDFDHAYDRFRSAFTEEGDPVHYHVSYTVLADLAAAAARRGDRADARAILEHSAERIEAVASPRIKALLDRGRGLLAEADEAEPYFGAALADASVERWPFERAQARLDYGEWLRRRRRIVEARPQLTAALETFRRLGARPWIERALNEVRAAGIDTDRVTPTALAELAPQQQQIVRLAAQGLTNREIGERMFLSPRTVGSHLYRAFPKLGITARTQLRDVVEAADSSARI